MAFADGPQQVGTASKHAGFAAAATDMKDVQKHMHHVLNCLVGPNGKGFDESFGNPCNGQGQGAIPETADAATKTKLEVGADDHAASRLRNGRGCRQEGRLRRRRDAEIDGSSRLLGAPPAHGRGTLFAPSAGAEAPDTAYIRSMPHNNGPGFRPVGGFAEASPGFAGLTGAEMTAFVPHRPERPEKSEGGRRFKLVSDYDPAGDQPQAIAELVEGLRGEGASTAPERDQVLLGVTGSGKTFTMAKVIQQVQRPALILAPNKTLAAQLYSEMKNFFPENAVEYFVSYYDYYQPEAYIPRTDTYIEKDSSVNEQIDRMRHSATRAILERDDVIIVASVSCIYGIGAVETYSGMAFGLERGQRIPRAELLARLVALQFRRNDEALRTRLFPRPRRHDRHLPRALRGPRLARSRCSATRSIRSSSSIR